MNSNRSSEEPGRCLRRQFIANGITLLVIGTLFIIFCAIGLGLGWRLGGPLTYGHIFWGGGSLVIATGSFAVSFGRNPTKWKYVVFLVLSTLSLLLSITFMSFSLILNEGTSSSTLIRECSTYEILDTPVNQRNVTCEDKVGYKMFTATVTVLIPLSFLDFCVATWTMALALKVRDEAWYILKRNTDTPLPRLTASSARNDHVIVTNHLSRQPTPSNNPPISDCHKPDASTMDRSSFTKADWKLCPRSRPNSYRSYAGFSSPPPYHNFSPEESLSVILPGSTDDDQKPPQFEDRRDYQTNQNVKGIKNQSTDLW